MWFQEICNSFCAVSASCVAEVVSAFLSFLSAFLETMRYGLPCIFTVETSSTYRMDRRNALKWMEFSLAAATIAGIVPLTHSAIIKVSLNDIIQSGQARCGMVRPPLGRRIQ